MHLSLDIFSLNSTLNRLYRIWCISVIFYLQKLKPEEKYNDKQLLERASYYLLSKTTCSFKFCIFIIFIALLLVSSPLSKNKHLFTFTNYFSVRRKKNLLPHAKIYNQFIQLDAIGAWASFCCALCDTAI